jgi:lysyl-tRNA synthetase class 2
VREDDWRPTCSIDALVERSAVLSAVRSFFSQRHVLEVDTPVLSRTTVTEPAIESLYVGVGSDRMYLQTSPEYQMKRLIAAGAPSIVRIGPVFRAEESGRLHNPEFTMIEWYRLGFDLAQLIGEVEALVDLVLGAGRYRHLTYRQLLREGAGVDPYAASEPDLREALGRLRVELSPNARVGRRDLLDLLVTHAIDAIGEGRVFVTDYPEDQAALARVVRDSEGQRVAKRFELIVDGIEIANGYDELVDAEVLERRMGQDRAMRMQAGQEQPEVDSRLLDAMRSGLPSCSGVALGFDRLLMLKLGVARIDAAMAFGFSRA